MNKDINIAKKIDHINMVVPNLSASLRWYTEQLGFQVKGHFSQGGFDIYYIDNGSIVYELFENRSLQAPIVDHIAYISDDIKADHAYYTAQGLQVSPISYIDFTWERGADYFFIQGAGGEKVELIQVR